MKTLVSIEGLKFRAFHGFYDEERKKGNDFICDVQVEIKNFNSADDNIYDTVNYESIYDIVKDEMSKTKKLIETVAYHILERVRKLDNVTGASVRLSKLNPPINGIVDRAVVEMKI